MSQDKFEIPFTTPVVPNLMDGNDTIQFRCHTQISCFNACCRQADITLTPYDLLRLKTRLGISTTEVLEKYTVPFEMDASGMPGIKLKTEAKQPTCLFLTEKGCGIYEDRPAACRYYPMGLMALRVKDENHESHRYCMVVEDHCKGHEEDRKLTVAEYRKEQDVEEFDAINKEWYQIILKKRSSGPAIGKPTATSFQIFFMASYDLDRFRRFVESPGFKDTYPLGDEVYQSFDDDVVLLKFGFKFLKQVLFAEMTIPVKENALQERYEKRKDNIKLQRLIEREEHKSRTDQYRNSR